MATSVPVFPARGATVYVPVSAADGGTILSVNGASVTPTSYINDLLAQGLLYDRDPRGISDGTGLIFIPLVAAANNLPTVTDPSLAILISALHLYTTLDCTGASGIVLTLPSDANDANIPVGGWGEAAWRGIGKPRFVAGAGAFLEGTLWAITAPEKTVRWKKKAPNTYQVTGATDT